MSKAGKSIEITGHFSLDLLHIAFGLSYDLVFDILYKTFSFGVNFVLYVLQ